MARGEVRPAWLDPGHGGQDDDPSDGGEDVDASDGGEDVDAGDGGEYDDPGDCGEDDDPSDGGEDVVDIRTTEGTEHRTFLCQQNDYLASLILPIPQYYC